MNQQDDCQHDWRVHPYKVTVEHPAKVFLTFIRCNKKTTAPFYFEPKKNRKMDPTTWKKYTGDTDNI